VYGALHTGGSGEVSYIAQKPCSSIVIVGAMQVGWWNERMHSFIHTSFEVNESLVKA